MPTDNPPGGSGKTPGGIPAADWQLAQKWGHTYGVDPLLLVAIGLHETDWGKLGDGRKGNILGVGSYDSGSTYKWAGADAQLHEGAKILAAHGVHTIADVIAGKARWWATDPNWAKGVASWYNKIKNGFSSPSAGSPTPSSPGGGLLGQVLGLPKEVTGFLQALEKPVHAALWLVNPTSWARIIAAVAGFLLLGAGLVTLAKAA